MTSISFCYTRIVSDNLIQVLGEIEYFEKGKNHKWIFVPKKGNGKKYLIKAFPNVEMVRRLITIKKIFLKGSTKTRFSPFRYAAPFGYGIFKEDHFKSLGIPYLQDTYFMVYYFADEYKDLSCVFMEDDLREIVFQSKKFDYTRRKKIAKQFFNIYSSLENLQEYSPSCHPFQILHYDIKADNYLIGANDEVLIIDIDQSGLYLHIKPTPEIITEYWIDESAIVGKRIFKPKCEPFGFYFLPYEYKAKEINIKDNLHKEFWANKEKATEIWLAWLMIFRVLTGIQNPFIFIGSRNIEEVYLFIQENKVEDLFSLSPFIAGDFLKNIIPDQNERAKKLENITDHYNNSLSPHIKEILNTVFLKGYYNFYSRPKFNKYKNISNELFD
ncbi:MAG: hypothetical protein KDE33_01940 [Bacteroidetes bacterium]|nr:hypothetical protein [Bacteroidota bacterium]